MSDAYMQTLAHMALCLGLVCGVALGYFAADVVEMYWARRPARTRASVPGRMSHPL